jgi:hypothetical protein
MNKSYAIEQPSQTMGSVLIVMGLAAAAAVVGNAPHQFPYTPRIMPSVRGTTSARVITYGPERSASFEEEVGDFYGRLQAAQEPLGAQFEKILVDNLWGLYSRS